MAIAFCASAHAESLQIFVPDGVASPADTPIELYGTSISPNGDYICGTINFGADPS